MYNGHTAVAEQLIAAGAATDITSNVSTCSSYTMPTRGVSRIHEAIINKPEGVARGFIDYC